jgi:integrase
VVCEVVCQICEAYEMATNKLSAVLVNQLSKVGRHSDGGGLYLYIRDSGSKTWEYRYQLHGNRHFMGLGAYDKAINTLADARKAASRAKALLLEGIDPIDHANELEAVRIADLERKREALKVKEAKIRVTFQYCAERYIKDKSEEWKNAKHKQQWENTLEAYVYPIIGDIPINDIDIKHVRECLDPIWITKTETATRVRQRIEAVISSAIAEGEREKSNPAIWKGLLSNFYPNPAKVKRKKHIEAGTDGHFAALPYEDMPDFMAELLKLDGIAPLALRFLILTVPRTTELRLALPNEIDLGKKIWTVPAGRMKASIRHRVALSDAAIETYNITPHVAGNDYIFAGWRKGRPLSDGGLMSVLRSRMEIPDFTVHGFRSTFRDYIGEETGFPERLAEFAIAHQLTDETEKAYARGDKLKKRFAMMNAWASYCDSKIKKSNIIAFSRQA